MLLESSRTIVSRMPEIRIPVNELNRFDLPKVCVMTGSTDPSVDFRPVKFQWYPPWVNALILINLLVMAIVARVMTKIAKGELAFSDEAWKRWRAWRIGLGASGLAMLIALFAALALLANQRFDVGGVLFLAGLVQFIIVAVMAGRAGPKVVSLKDDVLVVKTPSAEAGASYARHLTVRPARVS